MIRLPISSNKPSTRSFSLFKTLLLTLLVISPIQAKCDTLKAAVFDIPPYSYRTDEGKLAGIIPDFIERLSERLNIDITIQQYPYARMLQILSEGESDFSIFVRSNITEELVESLVKVGDLDMYIIGKQGTDIDSYNDLKNLIISQPLGTFYDERFDNDPSIHKMKVDGHGNAVRLLVSGRIDAIAGPVGAIKYELNKIGAGHFKLGKPYLLAKKEIWLRFSRKSGQIHIKDKITQATEALVKEGYYKELYAKYFPTHKHVTSSSDKTL